jgi:hypothetical protein
MVFRSNAERVKKIGRKPPDHALPDPQLLTIPLNIRGNSYRLKEKLKAVTVPLNPSHQQCGELSISGGLASEHRGRLLAE